MSDRILLVGEDFGNSPQRYHNDRYALTGASGRRLASLAFDGENLVLQLCLEFDRTNVVELADHWRDPAAVARGVEKVLFGHPNRRLVLMGNKVAAAFGVSELPLFEWGLTPLTHDVRVARMPHPSGRSHWWNDSNNVWTARAFMRSLVAEEAMA